jgi:hypothetical protein
MDVSPRMDAKNRVVCQIYGVFRLQVQVCVETVTSSDKQIILEARYHLTATNIFQEERLSALVGAVLKPSAVLRVMSSSFIGARIGRYLSEI